tara:strand:- start:43 stop:276 length:234 start_codon:yes stop_codon:yes gene_type:complete
MNKKNKRDRSKKFIELAEKRVNRVLNDIKLISNLSNRSNYEYSNKQAMKIIRVIDEEVKRMKMQFNKNIKKDKKFKL